MAVWGEQHAQAIVLNVLEAAGDFRDQAGREPGKDLGDRPPAGLRAGIVDRAQVLVAVPGEGDLTMRRLGCQLYAQALDLLLDQALRPDPQGLADLVERIAGPTAIAHDILRYAASDFVDALPTGLHYIVGAQLTDACPP